MGIPFWRVETIEAARNDPSSKAPIRSQELYLNLAAQIQATLQYIWLIYILQMPLHPQPFPQKTIKTKQKKNKKKKSGILQQECNMMWKLSAWIRRNYPLLLTKKDKMIWVPGSTLVQLTILQCHMQAVWWWNSQGDKPIISENHDFYGHPNPTFLDFQISPILRTILLLDPLKVIALNFDID